jgi:hypothetical protein
MEKWGPENNVWVWKYSLSDHKYIISADVSRGDSKDYSAFHVIDTNTSEVVCEFKGKIPPDQFATLLVEAGKRYNNALLCPENNTYGYAVLVRLQDLQYQNIYFKKKTSTMCFTEMALLEKRVFLLREILDLRFLLN